MRRPPRERATLLPSLAASLSASVCLGDARILGAIRGYEDEAVRRRCIETLATRSSPKDFRRLLRSSETACDPEHALLAAGYGLLRKLRVPEGSVRALRAALTRAASSLRGDRAVPLELLLQDLDRR